MTKLDPNNPRDRVWFELGKAWHHKPHRATEMCSLTSTPPMRSYYCPHARCQMIEYSCGKYAPICYGAQSE